MSSRYKRLRRISWKKKKCIYCLSSRQPKYTFRFVTSAISLLLLTTSDVSRGATDGLSISNRNINGRIISVFDPFSLRRIILKSAGEYPRTYGYSNISKIPQIKARPSIRIPYRPALRSPYRPPLVRRR